MATSEGGGLDYAHERSRPAASWHEGDDSTGPRVDLLPNIICSIGSCVWDVLIRSLAVLHVGCSAPAPSGLSAGGSPFAAASATPAGKAPTRPAGGRSRRSSSQRQRLIARRWTVRQLEERCRRWGRTGPGVSNSGTLDVSSGSGSRRWYGRSTARCEAGRPAGVADQERYRRLGSSGARQCELARFDCHQADVSSLATLALLQRGNPIIPFIKGVPWEYGEIVPDYVVGAHSCVLYLSYVRTIRLARYSVAPGLTNSVAIFAPGCASRQTAISPASPRIPAWPDREARSHV